MLYVLDTADISAIKRAYDLYPMDGVTTNPSILAREKREPIDILNEIRQVIGQGSMLHVQVLSSKAEDMVLEAKHLKERIGGNLYIKIPVIPQGIKAMKILKKEGYQLTGTAIFTPQQALMAAKAGADFVAPYVDRIDNIGSDGVSVVQDIVKLFWEHDVDSKVLAASFKNVQQVHNSVLAGAESITLTLETLERLIFHPSTDWSVDQFAKDWERIYGKNTNIVNATII